jgi:putative two-component system response regulator
MQSLILLDDNLVNLKWLEMLGRRLEHTQCISFTNPLAALDYARAQRVDLVVLGYMMQEMNGLEFIAAFRAL